MHIRTATADDVATLQRLARQTWYEHYPAIISTEQIEYMLGHGYSAERISAELESGVCWEIAETAGEPVGFSACELMPDERVKLHKIYALLATRSSGVGFAMFQSVVDRAREKAASAVYLQVNKTNLDSVAFYLRQGMSFERSLTDDIGGGFEMNDYQMTLWLDR